MSETGFFRILLVSVLGFTLLGWGLALHQWQAGAQKIATAVESPAAKMP